MKTISVRTSELTDNALEHAYRRALYEEHGPGTLLLKTPEGVKRLTVQSVLGEYADIPEDLVDAALQQEDEK